MNEYGVGFSCALCLIASHRLVDYSDLARTIRRTVLKNYAVVRLQRGRLSSLRFCGRTITIGRIASGCRVPLVVGSQVSVTVTIRTAKMRVKRRSLPTTTIHGMVKRGVLLKMSTSSVTRTVRTRRSNTSCLKINTVFPAKAGASTSSMSVRRLRGVHTTISLPVIIVNNVGGKGTKHFGPVKVSKLTIMSTVVTRSSVGTTTTRLGSLFYKGRGGGKFWYNGL